MLMVDFHHAPKAKNVRLRRNESAARLGRDDATLRKRPRLVWRYVDCRRIGRVDQLVEARAKIGISQQAILVTNHVVKSHAALGGGQDQSSLFVDGVRYVQSHPSAPMAGVSQEPLLLDYG